MAEKFWHRIIKQDKSKVLDMVDYFQQELEAAKAELKQVGVIETVLQKLPSYYELRFSQLQQIESVMEIMEIEMKRIEAEKYKHFLEFYKRQLTSSDVKKYIEGDADVVAYSELMVEIAFIRNHYMGLVKSLEMKSFALGHVVKLRAAGIEDSTLG